MTGNSLVKSGGIVGIMTLLSRILGFVRDQVIAIVFGAGATTDVWLVAFKIPNFLRRLFAEGAFAQAFIPVLSEYKETRSRAAMLDLAGHVAGTLTIILLIISTLGVMLAPILIMGFAPGYIDSPEQFELATHMLRITFPYLAFVSLVSFAGSMLNTFGKFAVPSATPVILNICMIVAALWASPMFETPIVALAWGVFAAGVIQLLFQIPFLQQLGLLPRPRWSWKHSGVRRILNLMAPAILGSSVAQINLLLDTIIASFLAAGSLSWLYYSDRLMEFPLGLLGVTIGTVILPRLSKDFSNQSASQFSATISWALRLMLVLGLPACIGLIVLAEPMLTTLFEYGKFTQGDSLMASYSLIAYSLGLPAFILIKIFAPAFFSRQNTKTPVRIGIIALISNMAFNLILVIPLVLMDFTAPHTGLALATTLSAWQQAWMLYSKLKKDGIYHLPAELKRFALRVLPAIIVMAVVIFSVSRFDWHELTAVSRASRLLGVIGAGALSYAIMLSLTGVRPRHLSSS